jgi:hypothetical protein
MFAKAAITYFKGFSKGVDIFHQISSQSLQRFSGIRKLFKEEQLKKPFIQYILRITKQKIINSWRSDIKYRFDLIELNMISNIS